MDQNAIIHLVFDYNLHNIFTNIQKRIAPSDAILSKIIFT